MARWERRSRHARLIVRFRSFLGHRSKKDGEGKERDRSEDIFTALLFSTTVSFVSLASPNPVIMSKMQTFRFTPCSNDPQTYSNQL